MYYFISYELRQFGVPAIIRNIVVDIHPIEWFEQVHLGSSDSVSRILFWEQISQEHFVTFSKLRIDRN